WADPRKLAARAIQLRVPIRVLGRVKRRPVGPRSLGESRAPEVARMSTVVPLSTPCGSVVPIHGPGDRRRRRCLLFDAVAAPKASDRQRARGSFAGGGELAQRLF